MIWKSHFIQVIIKDRTSSWLWICRLVMMMVANHNLTCQFKTWHNTDCCTYETQMPLQSSHSSPLDHYSVTEPQRFSTFRAAKAHLQRRVLPGLCGVIVPLAEDARSAAPKRCRLRCRSLNIYRVYKQRLLMFRYLSGQQLIELKINNKSYIS